MSKYASALVISVLLLVSCAEKTGDLPQKPVTAQSFTKIAVIPKGTAHIFWQSVHAGALKAAQESNIQIYWNGPAKETDIQGQINILENYIDNNDISAIVIAPCDEQALVRYVERAMENKPVVIFDSAIKTDKYASFVATDNYQGGVLAAEQMGKLLGGKGKVAVIGVLPGGASTTKRENGFQDTIRKKFPDIKLLPIKYGMSDVGESMRVTEDVLTANPDLTAIFASNESSTVGALRALKSQKKVKTIPLVGFDSSPELLDALRKGEIEALVVQDPFSIGYQAVSAAIQALMGDQPPKRVKTALRVVTAKNIDDPELKNILAPDLDMYLNK